MSHRSFVNTEKHSIYKPFAHDSVDFVDISKQQNSYVVISEEIPETGEKELDPRSRKAST